MKTLLTGFGPFAGVIDNPSGRIVRHFGSAGAAGHEITAHVLPVSFKRADAEIRELIRAGDFDLALLLGVAGNASRFRLESIARNVDRARIPDCDGSVPQGLPIVEEGPSTLATPVDAASLQVRLAGDGFEAEVSEGAGGYVCNHAYYAALDEISQSSLKTRCLFVHMPPDELTFAEPVEQAVTSMECQVAFVGRLLALLRA